MINSEMIPVYTCDHNMRNYEETCESFDWNKLEKEFDWKASGQVNIAYECVDKNVMEKGLGNKICLKYVDSARRESVSFAKMMAHSNKFANVLKKHGIQKGDRVFIFMPRCPEFYYSFLGIIKIGAIAGPLFEAFMEGAVKDRLLDSEAVAIITTPALRPRINTAELPHLKQIFVVADDDYVYHKGEINWRKAMRKASAELEVTRMKPEDPMLLMYTSGSTGKPKGILHAHASMVHHSQTGKWVLDLKPDDIYWCTADPGWATGISYGIFAPYMLGVTSIVRGGRFSVEEWYQTLESQKVTVWYSTPTAFRMLMATGDDSTRRYDLSRLRHVLSVGEPLDPEIVRWGTKILNLRIHDNWWMTETGGVMVANYPCMPIKPGSMGKPFPGVTAGIIDDNGKEVGPNQLGHLAFRPNWPGIMRGIWNNNERYSKYFHIPDWFLTGDFAYRDEDGYIWYQGRADDCINTSGERINPFEVEAKLLEHPAVAEAGVIGKPDSVRGEIIKAFVSLKAGYAWDSELEEELREFVRKGLAAHEAPREIEVRDRLPKSRSGKIMRRVLKAMELGLPTGALSDMMKEE